MLEISGYTRIDAPVVHESARSLVFRARRVEDGRPVIVKTTTDELPQKRILARLRREFEITARPAGDGVIEAIELCRVGARLALVVEDFGGESLAVTLRRGKLDVVDALKLGARVARALARVHRASIIHKDVCPANVVWNAKTGALKLIDFGIATELPREAPDARGVGVLEGTLAYMSPEQTGRMNRVVDWRADLYSLGVMLFEMLTGRRPFDATDAVELVHQHLAKVPPAAHAVDRRVPEQVSAIVARLLEKNAEDRYQGGGAVADDLERAADELRERGKVSRFELATTDKLDRFQLPQKLYGRDGERARLLEAFDRAAEGGRRMMLVAGYSGIGKSSLVHEVHRPIVERRGYFISGKFDQLARDVPYASLIQAFHELVQQLLGEPPDVLARHRERLHAALGPNGQVIVDVIPDVEHVIGPQPKVPALGAAEAENRFHFVFEAFVRAFASAEHPLTVFLDDLQWADLPSLSLVGRFLTDPETSHMLLVGAYRDNEVDASHPLMLAVERLRRQGAEIETITVPPLTLEHASAFVADAVARPVEDVETLAALAHEKTGGNPFFLGQFLISLHDAGLIRFDDGRRRWTWDLDAIGALGSTDNVVELMLRKLRSLAEPTRVALRTAAAIGNAFDLRTLAIAMATPALDAAKGLHEALREGLVVPLGSEYMFLDGRLDERAEAAGDAPAPVEYRFLHDRVQQAAYALVPDDARAALHLAIGRQLLERLSNDELHERLFEVVGHLTRGASLVAPGAERRRYADLAFEAGRRAKASAAYRPALQYLTTAESFVGEAAWSDDHDFALDLHLHLTEAAYLTGDFERMESAASSVLAHARTLLDRVKIAEVRVQAYIGQNRLTEAIDTALAVLAELGVTFPAAPAEADVVAAIGETQGAIAGRGVDELYALPELEDPEKRAAIRLLQRITSATYVARPALFPLVPMKGVTLSATYGNTAASTYAYACYGIILAGVVGDVHFAFDVSQLAVRLVDRFGAKEFEARTRYIDGCYVRHWTRPAVETYEAFLPIYRIGLETGDLEFSGWALMMAVFHGLYSGRPLDDLEPETARSVEAIRQVKQATALGYAEVGHQAMRCLLGKTPDPTRLDDPAVGFDAAARLAQHEAAGDAFGVANLLFHEMLLATLFGDVERAREVSARLDPWVPSMVATIHVPTLVLFDSLWRVRRAAVAAADERDALVARVEAQAAQLAKWAAGSPVNHAAKQLVVEGELARVRGDLASARKKLREAAETAARNDDAFEEALALERLADLWQADGEPEAARIWYARAHQAYTLWGATAKAAQIEALAGAHGRAAQGAYAPMSHAPASLRGARMPSRRPPSLPPSSPATVVTDTTTTTSEGADRLDLQSVLKASQAISGEVELDSLLGKMMTIVLENGGADAGALVLAVDGTMRLVARASTERADVERLSEPLALAVERGRLPSAVVLFAERARAAVVVGDATSDPRCAADPYFASSKARSVLCQPLVHQGQLVGLLYLENGVAAHAFTPRRLGTLELLAGQMAISLQNAKLFDETRAVERANARFVPYQFLEALRRTRIVDVRLGDHVRREFSIFFSDIRGFTRIVERLNPDALLAFVNEYLAAAEPEITGARGFVDTYLGDGIMAIFGEGADSAVAGAIGMQRALARHNEVLVSRGEAPLRTGIGINTGVVTLATIGGQNALKCSVLGDPVNLASRIEGLTKRYGAGVLVSEHTHARLVDRDRWAMRRVARVQVVGKTLPVAIYEVLDAEPEPLRTQKLETRAWFEEALDLYEARRTREALERFEACVAVAKDDVAPALFAATCRDLLARGLPDGWDGIERLSEK